MKRLFFALWPDQSIRRQCQQLSENLGGFGKSVAANNLHVTLVFLGSVDDEQQRAMMCQAKQLEIKPFCIYFNRISYWKKPAVLCLRSGKPDAVLLNLVDKLVVIAKQNRIAVDERSYIPHVTLLRKAKVLPQVDFEPIIWQASSFCLVESCSTPTGVEYRIIERWDSTD